MRRDLLKLLLGTVICISVFFLTPEYAEAAENKTAVQAPTNEDTVTQEGDQVYYAGGSAIYRGPAAGGAGTPVVSLADLGINYGGFSFLNVDGGQLFFYVWTDRFNPESAGIYRHDLSTGQNIRLLKANDVLAMSIKDGWITYVVSPGANALYCISPNLKSIDTPMNGGRKLFTVSLRKLKTDGTGDQATGASFPGWANSFLLTDDLIYYVDMRADFPLCRMKVDGTEQKVLCNEAVDCSGMGIAMSADDWIYFISSTQGFSLCRVKTDGSGYERVADDGPGALAVSNVGLFCSAGDYKNIHRDENDNVYEEQVIYRLKDGNKTELFRICDKNWTGIFNLQPIGDWVYFTVRHPHEGVFFGFSGGHLRNYSYEVYRMKSDGTGLELLSTGNPEDGMYYWEDGSCIPDSERV